MSRSEVSQKNLNLHWSQICLRASAHQTPLKRLRKRSTTQSFGNNYLYITVALSGNSDLDWAQHSTETHSQHFPRLWAMLNEHLDEKSFFCQHLLRSLKFVSLAQTIKIHTKYNTIYDIWFIVDSQSYLVLLHCPIVKSWGRVEMLEITERCKRQRWAEQS